jgi:hypothetical protein
MASLQGFRCEFPTQWNRELFWRNRESWRESREFYRSELESSPDEIFGTKDLLGNVRFTPESGHLQCASLCPLSAPIADIQEYGSHKRKTPGHCPGTFCGYTASSIEFNHRNGFHLRLNRARTMSSFASTFRPLTPGGDG